MTSAPIFIWDIRGSIYFCWMNWQPVHFSVITVMLSLLRASSCISVAVLAVSIHKIESPEQNNVFLMQHGSFNFSNWRLRSVPVPLWNRCPTRTAFLSLPHSNTQPHPRTFKIKLFLSTMPFVSLVVQPDYFLCFSLCLPTCLSVCLSICLSVCLSVWLSVCLPLSVSVYLCFVNRPGLYIYKTMKKVSPV